MSLSQQRLSANTKGTRYRSGSRRWIKNQTNRRMRRAAKYDPEKALRRKQYRGWL